ncbi:MAG: hypothetical protein ISR65_14565 [Bacteriovoracaceae bacterium]|nr:hypothetical protein [Bacteriovoracaceae bacterium]
MKNLLFVVYCIVINNISVKLCGQKFVNEEEEDLVKKNLLNIGLLVASLLKLSCAFGSINTNQSINDIDSVADQLEELIANDAIRIHEDGALELNLSILDELKSRNALEVIYAKPGSETTGLECIPVE